METEMTIELKEYEKEKGPLSVQEAGKIVILLCHTLDTMHKEKKVYRELSPENILLIFEERAESKYLREIRLKPTVAERKYHVGAKEDTVAMGIERYAAPEQYGFAQSMPATDIYAVGIIFQEMITGKTPEETSEAELPDRNSWYAIVAKCCEMDWKKRYQSVRDIAKDLEWYLSHENNSGFGWRLWRNRKRVWQIVLLGGLCVALIAGGYVLVSQKLDREQKTESRTKQKETQTQEEEYQKLVLDDEGLVIYYPIGFHPVFQNPGEESFLASFSTDTGDGGLLAVMVAHNREGYTLEEIARQVLQSLQQNNAGKETLREQDEDSLRIFYQIDREGQDGIMGMQCVYDNDMALVVYGAFYEGEEEKYAEIFDTMLKKLQYKDYAGGTDVK